MNCDMGTGGRACVAADACVLCLRDRADCPSHALATAVTSPLRLPLWAQCLRRTVPRPATSRALPLRPRPPPPCPALHLPPHLDFSRCEELQQCSVYHDKWLAPRDGQRVGVGCRVLRVGGEAVRVCVWVRWGGGEVAMNGAGQSARMLQTPARAAAYTELHMAQLPSPLAAYPPPQPFTPPRQPSSCHHTHAPPQFHPGPTHTALMLPTPQNSLPHPPAAHTALAAPSAACPPCPPARYTAG